MKLNHDCIRDILLFIEENVTEENDCVDVSNLTESLKSKYDIDTIYYHIRQIHKAGLVDDVSYGDGNPMFISDLSWEGHSYVDNIRDNKVWAKVKEKTKGIASASLPVLIEYAKMAVISYIQGKWS